MADIEVGIDASRAEAGARKFVSSAESMARAARVAYEEVRQLQATITALRSLDVSIKINTQSFQAAKQAVEQTTQATKELGKTEDLLAKDRIRAAREASRADGERLKQIQRLENELARERQRSAQQQSRLDSERLRAIEREAAARARAIEREEAARVRLVQLDQRNAIRQASRADADRVRQIEREERAARQQLAREERAAARQVARERQQALREEQRLAQQLAADRLRAARELSREDARRLAQAQRLERELAGLRQRTASPRQQANLRRGEDEALLGRAQAAGLLNARQTLALRQQIAAHYAREAQNAGALRNAVTQLSQSFGTLASTTALAIPGLVGIQETLLSISGTLGGGGGGFGGAVARTGVVGGVLALGAAFASIGAVQGIAQASIDFEKIRGALRAATGDTEKAEEEFSFLSTVANRLGTDLRFSALEYAKLASAAKSANYDLGQARAVFLGVAEASAALRLGADETAGILYALQQVISQNTLKSEELKRQLGDRLPGAFAIAAAALKKTPEELTEAMEKGLVSAQEFIPAFARALHDMFGGEALQASEELLGQLNRLKNAIFELQVQAGQTGIIDALTEGVEKLRDALKDPDTQQGLMNIATLLGGTIRYIVENAETVLKVLAAMSGAAIGGTIAGPIGAAVGGVVGYGGAAVGLGASSVDNGQLAQAKRDVIALENTYRDLLDAGAMEDADKFKQRIIDLRAEIVSYERGLATTVEQQDAYEKAAEAAAKVTENQGDKTKKAAEAFKEWELDLDKAKKAQTEYAENIKTIDQALKDNIINEERANELRLIAKETLDKATGTAKEMAKAEREAAKEAKQAAKERAQAAIELVGYIGNLQQSVVEAQEDVNANRVGEKAIRDLARARAINNALIEAQRLALERKSPLSEEEIRQVTELAGRLSDLQFELTDVQKAQQEAEAEQKRRLEQQQELILEPFKEAARSIQSLFADTFEKIFDGGVDTFQEFKTEVFNIMKRLAAEIASLLVFQPIINAVTGAFQQAQAQGPTQAVTIVSNVVNGQLTGQSVVQGGSPVAGVGKTSLLSPGNLVKLGGNLASGFRGLTQVGAIGGYGAGLTLRGLNAIGIGLSGAQQVGVISAFSPAAGIAGFGGSLLANALGLGSKNPYINAGFGAAGGIAGGIAGGAALGASLGAFAGPIGALVGAFIGTAISGLVGSNQNSRSRVAFGGFGLQPGTSVNFEGTGDKVFLDNINNAYNEINKAVTQLFSGDQLARIQAARTPFYQQFTFRSNEEGKIKETLREGFKGVLAPIFYNLEGVRGGELFQQVVGVGGGDPQKTVEEALNRLQEVSEIQKAIKEFTDQNSDISDSKKALNDLNEAFDELYKRASELLFTSEELAKIEATRAQAIDRLKAGFQEGIEGQILEVENPLKKQLDELEKARDEQIKNAQDLGLEINRIEYLYGIRRAQIVDGFNKTITDRILALEDPLAASLKALDEWRDEQIQNAITLGVSTVDIERLYALERQRIIEEANQSIVNSFEQAKNNIQEFLRELTSGSSSPLSSQVVFNNATQELIRLNSLALTGTPEQQAEALASLPEAAANLLDAAERLYASGPQFFAVFNSILRLLEARGLQADQGPDLPAFATGGSFVIPGNTGPDTRVVKFRGNGGERVSISRQSDQMAMLRGLKEVGQEIARGNSETGNVNEKLLLEIKLLRRELASR